MARLALHPDRIDARVVHVISAYDGTCVCHDESNPLAVSHLQVCLDLCVDDLLVAFALRTAPIMPHPRRASFVGDGVWGLHEMRSFNNVCGSPCIFAFLVHISELPGLHLLERLLVGTAEPGAHDVLDVVGIRAMQRKPDAFALLV